MREKLEIDFKRFQPYVRYAHINGGPSDLFFVPTRIIYDYEMIFMTEGELLVRTEDQSYLLTAGDLHVMKPFVTHKRTVPEGKHCFYYNIHFDLMYDGIDFSTDEVYAKPCDDKLSEAEIIPELANRNIYELKDFILPSKLKIINTYEYQVIFDKIIAAYEENTLPSKIRLSGYMMVLISMMFDSMIEDAGAENYAEIISKCSEFIINNYNTDVDIVALALEYGFSPNYFRKIFKKLTHMSPHDFLISYRLDQAKKLLLTGQYKINEVAYMVGYNNPYYFSRAYKKQFGVPPSENVR